MNTVLDIIDAGIQKMGSRKLAETTEVVDLLLDIRNELTGTESDTSAEVLTPVVTEVKDSML